MLLSNQEITEEIKEEIKIYLETNYNENMMIQNLWDAAKAVLRGKYKTLIKEIKDDTNRWGDIQCSWIRGINIVKMTIIPKPIYRFNAIPIKLPVAFFHRNRTKNLKICMERPKTQIAKAILRGKNGTGGIRLPDFRLYYKAIVINTI